MKNTARILAICLTTMLAASACSDSQNQGLDDIQAVSSNSLRKMTLPKGWTLKVIPPEYKTIIENVVLPNMTNGFVTIPPEYKWVDGEIEGYDVYEPLPHTITKPPVYMTIIETEIVQEAYIRLNVIPVVINDKGEVIEPMKVEEEHVPAVTKEVHRRVIKTPAQPIEPAEYAKIIESLKTPYLIENGRTRILVKQAQIIDREIPAVTKKEKRRIRVQNETYTLHNEKGQSIADIKTFDELKAARKTHP